MNEKYQMIEKHQNYPDLAFGLMKMTEAVGQMCQDEGRFT